MALDAGTTSNRCILFDKSGTIVSMAQKEFTQIFPQPGWVEHDANEIWSTQLGVAVEAMSKINVTAEDIAAIGITNQRETTIIWDKKTGQPICNAIVWQCRRTAEYCEKLLGQMMMDAEGNVLPIKDAIQKKNRFDRRSVFLRDKGKMGVRPRAAGKKTGRSRRTVIWNS